MNHLKIVKVLRPGCPTPRPEPILDVWAYVNSGYASYDAEYIRDDGGGWQGCFLLPLTDEEAPHYRLPRSLRAKRLLPVYAREYCDGGRGVEFFSDVKAYRRACADVNRAQRAYDKANPGPKF